MKATVETALVRQKFVTITLTEDEAEDVLDFCARLPTDGVGILLSDTIRFARLADRAEDERKEGEDVPF